MLTSPTTQRRGTLRRKNTAKKGSRRNGGVGELIGLIGRVNPHDQYPGSASAPNPAMLEAAPLDGNQASGNGVLGAHPLQEVWRLLKLALGFKKKEKAISMDSELEEENPVYRRPRDRLKDLASRTNFSRAELKALYRGFKADCPSGILRAEAFKNFYAQLFPKGAIASQYANYVFDAMDAQRTGLLGFEDLITTLSDLTRGNEERKWRWVFALYDVDGDGILSRADVEEVATSIYELTGVGMANSTSNIPLTLDADTSEAIQRSVEAFFEKMDRNRDGVITLDEFLKVCTDDALTRQSLDAFQHLV